MIGPETLFIHIHSILSSVLRLALFHHFMRDTQFRALLAGVINQLSHLEMSDKHIAHRSVSGLWGRKVCAWW